MLHWFVIQVRIIGGTKEVGPFEFDPSETSILLPKLAQEEVAVFPNPFNEAIILSTSAKQVEIYDVAGAKFVSVLNATRVNTSNLPKGIYLVRITALDGKVNVVKMIK